MMKHGPIPIYLFGTWILFIFTVARILESFFSGWHRLSKRFRTALPPVGAVVDLDPLFHVQLRHQNYGAIHFTAAESGLCLSMPFFSRLAHPPLMIPWSEIQIRPSRWLWIRQFVLTLGNTEQVPLRISDRIAYELEIVGGRFAGRVGVQSLLKRSD